MFTYTIAHHINFYSNCKNNNNLFFNNATVKYWRDFTECRLILENEKTIANSSSLFQHKIICITVKLSLVQKCPNNNW